MKLIDAWKSWEGRTPPFILEEDRPCLHNAINNPKGACCDPWEKVRESETFGSPADTRLHLGLFPQPFCGNLVTARIFVLMLNPGLGYGDYFAEYETPGFKIALVAGLRQEFDVTHPSFMYLDPRFAFHSGFRWWHDKFQAVIGNVAGERKIPFAQARRLLADQLASVELFPYHSRSFEDHGHWLRDLPSVKLVRDFVQNDLIPRTERGEALVIVTRKAKEWRVLASENVVVYGAGEAQAAHLSPESRGGEKILEFLDRHRT